MTTGEDAAALAERRAKKRDLIMKMTAPDRIEEDPLQEEQLATGRDSPVKPSASQVLEDSKTADATPITKKTPSQEASNKQKKKHQKKQVPKEEVKEEVPVVVVKVAKEVKNEDEDEWNVVTDKKFK